MIFEDSYNKQNVQLTDAYKSLKI